MLTKCTYFGNNLFSMNLNPQQVLQLRSYQSIDFIKQLMGNRMYLLTLDGISNAIRELS